MRNLSILIVLFFCMVHLSLAEAQHEAVSDSVAGVSLENWLVQAYLQEAANKYSSGIGRSGTSVLDYNVLGPEVAYFYSCIDSINTPNWAEQPAPVRLLTPNGSLVQVSASPSFDSVYSYSALRDTTLIYNLVPKTVYWYRVLNESDQIISRGTFKTLGNLRMIYSPNVRNIRDIGGWPCEGGRLSYGKIIRGGTLDNVTEEDKFYFKDKTHLNSCIDLRHDKELIYVDDKPYNPWSLAYEHYGILHWMFMMTNTWRYVSHPIKTGYYLLLGNLIKNIVDHPDDATFYIHCEAGADRTGTVIALIEALCGVSEQDIIKDWEATTFAGYPKFINVEKTSWCYTDANGNTVDDKAELRSVFQYLYANFQGASGATLQQQVESWFKTYIFTSSSGRKKYLEGIKSLLIQPDTKSPTLIKSFCTDRGAMKYAVAQEESVVYEAEPNTIVSKGDSLVSGSDYMTTSGLIDCEEYKCLLTNVNMRYVATFYAADSTFVGYIGDSLIAQDEILYDEDFVEYPIPEGAVSVKLNMPRMTAASIVLSVESMKKPFAESVPE